MATHLDWLVRRFGRLAERPQKFRDRKESPALLWHDGIDAKFVSLHDGQP
jgi:hypothetical protein